MASVNFNSKVLKSRFGRGLLALIFGIFWMPGALGFRFSGEITDR